MLKSLFIGVRRELGSRDLKIFKVIFIVQRTPPRHWKCLISDSVSFIGLACIPLIRSFSKKKEDDFIPFQQILASGTAGRTVADATNHSPPPPPIPSTFRRLLCHFCQIFSHLDLSLSFSFHSLLFLSSFFQSFCLPFFHFIRSSFVFTWLQPQVDQEEPLRMLYKPQPRKGHYKKYPLKTVSSLFNCPILLYLYFPFPFLPFLSFRFYLSTHSIIGRKNEVNPLRLSGNM